MANIVRIQKIPGNEPIAQLKMPNERLAEVIQRIKDYIKQKEIESQTKEIENVPETKTKKQEEPARTRAAGSLMFPHFMGTFDHEAHTLNNGGFI